MLSRVMVKLKLFLGAISRHIEVWRSAWTEQKRQEPVVVPQGRELEFLPAVLEIQESPPSPVGRTIIFIIIGVFTAALLWSVFGHIDIVAVAQGKIIPSDYSKVIQPLESGIIRKIHVRDGQHVKKDDVLIELDATTTGADRERYSNEYLSAMTEVARLQALITDQNEFTPPTGADPVFVKIQRNRLRDQLSEYRSLQNQAQAYKTLYDKQFVSRMQYLEADRARAQKAQEHAAEYSEAKTRAHSLSQELAKAENRASQQTLTAPIDGIVQQLAVHTVGGVVTPAQQLMVIAPREGLLEVEAWVDNKDIGFVNPEQIAEIKVEAFPFTRYGTIDGKILTLSKDAVPVDKVGLVYAARVSMNRSTIRVENDKEVYLSPGMTVTVEIKTGQRRLIEYFLSPLLQASKESIRER